MMAEGEDQHGSVLMMHLLDGEPQGPRILEFTHTNTEAIAVPRTAYERVSRKLPAFKRPGTYILVYDPSTGGPLTEKLYIGEADVAQLRLDQHARDPDKDWRWVVLFTSRNGRMNNAHAQFLEARLVALARQAGRAELVNANDPQEPTLDLADKSMALRFLTDVLVYCPILGLNAFTTPRTPQSVSAPPSPGVPEITSLVAAAPQTPSPVIYHLAQLPEAKGFNTDEGFVVLRGSPLRPGVAASADDNHGVTRHRTQLRERGILEPFEDTLRFTRDHSFNSPSQASILILGYPISGRTAWVTDDGITLNEVEASTLSPS